MQEKSIEIWTEKYRPIKLDDVLGQDRIVARLKAFVESKSLPHCLFSGSAGIGKTTSALALAKELYGEEWKNNFMETNASDERGIDVVRSKIKDFAKTKPLNASFKLIFLDEADALTPPAQQALRRTMEKYTNTTRFILSCNYSSKIIPPIQSRCAVFRFKPFESEDVKKRVKYICGLEKLELFESGLNAIVDACYGDMRLAVNILHSAAVMSKKIDDEAIYSVASVLKYGEVKDILMMALDKKFMDSRKKLYDIMFVRGLSGMDVIKAFHKVVVDLDVTDKDKAVLIDKLGEYEFRIVEGGTEDLQIEAFLAQVCAIDRK
jgi:replication factor C small subunit